MHQITISTKYELGDKVYAYSWGKSIEGTIEEIQFTIGKRTDIWYRINDLFVPEEHCYPSKQDFIDSL